MWRRKNLSGKECKDSHSSKDDICVSKLQGSSVWWTSLKGPLHCPLHTTTILWFMAPWLPIDRPIKCFPNNKISELMARLDWLIYEESLRSKRERIILAFIGWKALLRLLTKPSLIWLSRWVHDQNLRDFTFLLVFVYVSTSFLFFNHHFHFVFHELQRPNDLLQSCVFIYHVITTINAV